MLILAYPPKAENGHFGHFAYTKKDKKIYFEIFLL